MSQNGANEVKRSLESDLYCLLTGGRSIVLCADGDSYHGAIINDGDRPFECQGHTPGQVIEQLARHVFGEYRTSIGVRNRTGQRGHGTTTDRSQDENDFNARVHTQGE